jgi:hypothetical protein
MHKNRLQLVTHLNKYNVNSIREKVVLMYSAKNMVFGKRILLKEARINLWGNSWS